MTVNYVSSMQKVFRKVGINLTRFSPSPYEHLREVDRYKQVAVELLGRKFVVADGPSFYWSYREIFIEQIYKFTSETREPIIIDCGSNYGTSVIYYKTIFPEAKILAIEPDPYIFSLLAENVKKSKHNGITLINKAVSDHKKPLKFYQEGADGGRTHPFNSSKGAIMVEPINLDELIDGPIDFLKIDIEGAETEVICASEKLSNVKQVFIEYHSFVDAKQSLDKLLMKLANTGFRYYIHTQFCSPLPLTEKRTQLGMDLQLNIFGIRASETVKRRSFGE